MPKEIYNLGRVTGLSAYELNVKHQLEEYPNMPSMTEKEWLAATVTSGASLILRISAGTSAGAHDYPLPSDSTLCSGNSLIAYPFVGECEFRNNWAIKVTSYGPLISNTDQSHPVSPGAKPSDIPMSGNMDEDVQSLIWKMKDYAKIVDGVIYQAGDWEASGTTPSMDFKPNFNLGSTIRLYFDQNIKKTIYVLFTGLVNRAVIAGASKLDSTPLKSEHPENGDFIGPEVFPWGSKILFTVPTSMLRLYDVSVTDVSPDPSYKAYSANTMIDGDTISAIALEDPNGTRLKFDGSEGIITSDLIVNADTGASYLTWKSLLHALATNKKIDILTDRLRLFRSYLPDVHTETDLYVGRNAQINGDTRIEKSLYVGTNERVCGDLRIDGNISQVTNISVKENTQTNTFSASNTYVTINGIRLYVSSVMPTGDIPDGSLGIGW